MNLAELVERVKGRTPGPWEYQEHSDAYTHIVRGPKGEFIASCPQGTDGEDEANARLCAAAPSLLTLALELRRENEELRAELKAKGARIVGMENVKHIRGEE